VVSNALLLRRWTVAPPAHPPHAVPADPPHAVPAPEPVQPNGAEAPQSSGENTMIELTVQDMTCKHCVGRVTKAVQSIDADARVEIDLDTAQVRIDSRAERERIVAAIDAAGYPVTAGGAA